MPESGLPAIGHEAGSHVLDDLHLRDADFAGGQVTKTLCPYCHSKTVHKTAREIYGRFGETLTDRLFLACSQFPKCNAYVGCHENNGKPMGRLANKDLRQAKMLAHSFFDPLWIKKMKTAGVSKGAARSLAYRWLSKQMGMNPKECHIAMFDVDLCLKVVEACRPFYKAGAIS